VTGTPPVEPDGDGPTPTRPVDLLLLAVGVAIVVWLLLGVGYNRLPAVPGYAGATLYVLAAIEGWLARYIRGRLQRGEVGIGAGRLHPIAVARVLILAKASALLGACATGLWTGLVLFLAPRASTLSAAHADLPGSVIGLIGALLLAVAALVLERCCRTPDQPEDDLPDAFTA
jgi:hypothetical protein